jgi:hypothetical protein
VTWLLASSDESSAPPCVWSVVLTLMIIWVSADVKDDNASAAVAPALIAGPVCTAVSRPDRPTHNVTLSQG